MGQLCQSSYFISFSCYPLLQAFVSLYWEILCCNQYKYKYSWRHGEKRFYWQNTFHDFFLRMNSGTKTVAWLGMRWREGKNKYISRALHFSIWWYLKLTFLQRILCIIKESFPLVNYVSVVQNLNCFLLEQTIEVYHLMPQTNYNPVGYSLAWTSLPRVGSNNVTIPTQASLQPPGMEHPMLNFLQRP